MALLQDGWERGGLGVVSVWDCDGRWTEKMRMRSILEEDMKCVLHILEFSEFYTLPFIMKIKHFSLSVLSPTFNTKSNATINPGNNKSIPSCLPPLLQPTLIRILEHQLLILLPQTPLHLPPMLFL